MSSPEEEEKLKEKKPPVNIFKKGFIWRPVPRIYTTVLTFFIIGVVFIVLGVVLLHYSKDVKEVSMRYDDIKECDINEDDDALQEILEEPALLGDGNPDVGYWWVNSADMTLHLVDNESDAGYISAADEYKGQFTFGKFASDNFVTATHDTLNQEIKKENNQK